MALEIEPLWTVKELSELSGALLALEEFVQSWEQDYEIKIGDILVTLETMGRDPKPLGLVSVRDKNDTTLQFEAINVEIGPS